MPEIINLPIEVQVKVTDSDEFPDRMQINLRISTPGETPLTLKAEFVGIFIYLTEQARTNQAMKYQFLKERGLHQLWSYVVQIVKIMTSQMGMNGLNIATPIEFGLEGLRESEIGSEAIQI